MAAKTAAHDEQRKDWIIVAQKMAATETIYKWSTAVLQWGYAQTNDGTTNTLDAGDIFAWICVETKTNDGVDGAEDVRLFTEWNVIVDVVDTIDQTDVWAALYINNTSDDGAVTITVDAGVDLKVWIITEFISANKARMLIQNIWGLAA